MEIAQFLPDSDLISKHTRRQLERFFDRHEPVSRDACDNYAAGIAGDVHSMPIQGEDTYTMMTADSSKVIQFRTRRSPADIESLNLARDIYGSIFVPGCENHGVLGHLHVYVMDPVPGEALFAARKQLLRRENVHLLAVTVQDYAKFFASSWINRLTDGYGADRNWILARYVWHLTTLTKILPERFYAKLNEAITNLPKLFNDGWPTVFSHTELTEDNVHVDPNTGHITGVVDWLDADVRPFGLSLWALDTIIGVQTPSQWHWHRHHAGLRQQFWNAFIAAVGPLTDDQITTIKLGRMVGIFLEFPVELGPVEYEDDCRVVFLDTLLGVE